jgi:hypothetical protein
MMFGVMPAAAKTRSSSIRVTFGRPGKIRGIVAS